MTEGENEQRFADRTLYSDNNRLWRVCEMWWPQGEDDGSVLEYVTEDEPQRAPQIAHYTETTIGSGECVRCGGRKAKTTGAY